MGMLIAVLSIQGRPEAVCRGETSMETAQLVYQFFRKARENGYHVDVAYWNVDDLEPGTKSDA